MRDYTFAFKYVLPIATLIFIYFAIGSFLDSRLDKENLIEINGEISHIQFYNSMSRTGSNENIYIHLKGGNKYKVTYEWSSVYGQIQTESAHSEKIKLFHRKKYQTWLRFGTADIIYHLEIGDKVIIDISERNSESSFLSIMMGIVSILGISLITFRKMKKTNPNKA